MSAGSGSRALACASRSTWLFIASLEVGELRLEATAPRCEPPENPRARSERTDGNLERDDLMGAFQGLIYLLGRGGVMIEWGVHRYAFGLHDGPDFEPLQGVIKRVSAKNKFSAKFYVWDQPRLGVVA